VQKDDDESALPLRAAEVVASFGASSSAAIPTRPSTRRLPTDPIDREDAPGGYFSSGGLL